MIPPATLDRELGNLLENAYRIHRDLGKRYSALPKDVVSHDSLLDVELSLPILMVLIKALKLLENNPNEQQRELDMAKLLYNYKHLAHATAESARSWPGVHPNGR